MKLSELIFILAQHMAENGDRQVVLTDEKGDKQVRHCWYDADEVDFVVIGTGLVHISE